jgi:Zn-dependent protease with chaperone function
LLSGFIISFLFFCGISFIKLLDISVTYWSTIAVSLFIASIPLTYSFIIHPILTLFKSKNLSPYNFRLTDKIPQNIKIFIIEKNIINAFATGVLPFTKIILIGRMTLEKLSPEDVESLIFHEIGHIRQNHLLKLYFFNIIFLFFYILSFTNMISIYRSYPYTTLLVGLHGAIGIGLCLPFCIGLFQRKLEKEADTYSAKIVGQERCKSMLIHLNDATSGGLEVWSFNYPKLKERLENVDNS